jgi:hypothetical protein
MKMYLIFFVSGFLFSCSNNEDPIHIKQTDSAKVYLGPDRDTILLEEADSTLSEITCPKYNFKKKEKMPTEICLL